MRKQCTRFFLMLVMLSMIFVSSTEVIAAGSSQKVTLNYSEYTLKQGKSVTLKATQGSKTVKVKDLTFTSSNKKVATVSSKGKVTGKKKGTAKITVKVKSSNKKAVCKITVGQPVTKISVQKKNVTLTLGETSSIKTTISPAKASNKAVSYKSSNTSVVTVSSKGKLKAKKEGKAKITITARDGSKKKATVNVTVKKKVTPTKAPTKKPTPTNTSIPTPTPTEIPKLSVIGITLVQKDASGNEMTATTLEAGTTAQIKVEALVPQGITLRNHTYKSSNEEVASVDEKGLVTAIKNGEFSITVTAEDERGNKVEETADFVVGTHVSSVELNATEIAISQGEMYQLKANILPATANTRAVTYESDNEEVAKVSESGLVTALTPGTAQITVTTVDGSYRASCAVTVTGQADTTIAATQEELNAALTKEGPQNVKFVTNEPVNIEIPQGTYENITLTINAPAAHIENSALFKSIQIEAVGSSTFVEKASGNNIYYGAEQGTVRVDEAGSAALYLIPGAEKLNLINNGNVTGVTLNAKAQLNVSGSGLGTIEVTASSLAEGSNIITGKKLQVNAQAAITLEILSGGEETEVSVDTAQNLPDIYGMGRIYVEIQTTAKVEYIVGKNTGETEGAAQRTITGKVMLDSSTPMSGAKVYLIPFTGEEYDIAAATYSATTNENGVYTIEQAAIGNYHLIVMMEEYQTVDETFVLTDEGAEIYNAETVYMVKEGETATGNLSGTLYNAQNGLPVTAGIAVRIRAGKNNISGDYLRETFTDSQGKYTFENLPAGQYTVQVTDTREDVAEKYVDARFNAIVLANQNNEKNSTITAILGTDQIRFVLRWGDEESGASRDLDSHLVGPAHNNPGEFHTWFSSKNYGVYEGEDQSTYVRCADLDVDDVTWEGPETSTIYTKETGEYRFYIHDFSNRNSDNTDQMGKSSATVEVYVGSRLKATYYVPNEPGNLWYVCKYNAVEDTLTSVNTMSYWLEDESEIGVDLVLLRKTNLYNAMNTTKEILAQVSDEQCKKELSGMIEKAQKVYEESEDVNELYKTFNEVKELNNTYIYSTYINWISGENVLDYEVNTNEKKCEIFGDTREIPEYQVEVPQGSTYEIRTMTEGEYPQVIVVTGKGGYTTTYQVSYKYDENKILGIRGLNSETDDYLYFSTTYEEEKSIYVMNVSGYSQQLPEDIEIFLSYNKAEYKLEASDKEEYLKKLTVSYKELSRSYYITYKVNLETTSINGVTDGDGAIFQWSVNNAYENNSTFEYLYIKGSKAALSQEFKVQTFCDKAEIRYEDSDKEGYVRKVVVTYGELTRIYYVKYEQQTNKPYVLTLQDKDNFGFKATINYSWNEISATGLLDDISDNLELTVSEGSSWQREGSKIKVTDAAGNLETYTIYYSCDKSSVYPLSVTDEGNEIKKLQCFEEYIQIYGLKENLGSDVVFTMPEGVESEYNAQDRKLSVSVPAISYTTVFNVVYDVDESAVSITGYKDENNVFDEEQSYIGGKNIHIYGRNNELGSTIQFTVPEGAEVSAPVKVEEYKNRYTVTVKTEKQTKEYNIYYYQSDKYFALENITDENNNITYEKSSWGNGDGYVNIIGVNPELGESLQVKVAEGLSAEVLYAQKDEYGTYVFADGDTHVYPAKIVVKNGDASYNYYVTYEMDTTAVTITGYADENNVFNEEQGYIGKEDIDIYGRNNELGNTIKFMVPEGTQVSEPVKEPGSNNRYSVTVTKDELSKKYTIYYYQDIKQFDIKNVTDENNQITYNKDVFWGDDYGHIYITGMNGELGKSLQVEVAEGLSAEVIYAQKNEEGTYVFQDGDTHQYPAKVVVKNANAAYSYYVTYEVDTTSVTVTGYTDENNVFNMEEGYISKDFINIYGRNNELGTTIKFTVPEGAEVSEPVKDEENSYQYSITVSNGSLTKKYTINYYRDVEQFELKNVTDENNRITYEKSAWQGNAYGYVYITGANGELGNSLQPEVAEGLSAEVIYAQKNENGIYVFEDGDAYNYPAKIVVKNQEATFCYYVSYSGNATME